MLPLIRKDYPTNGVLKRVCADKIVEVCCATNQEGLPDYWGIETYALCCNARTSSDNQEGLPDYWGIETCRFYQTSCAEDPSIKQDYPTIGVLKQWVVKACVLVNVCELERATAYWGIEILSACSNHETCKSNHQEGLPNYWGIETIVRLHLLTPN